MAEWNKNLVLLNELIKVEFPLWKIWRAGVSNVSPSSSELTLQTSAFQSDGGYSTFINSFDKTKIFVVNLKLENASENATAVTCSPCSFTPESVRWLMIKGKMGEAVNVFKRMARVNKTIMPQEELKLPNDDQKLGDARELFATRKMTQKTLMSWYSWWVLICLLHMPWLHLQSKTGVAPFPTTFRLLSIAVVHLWSVNTLEIQWTLFTF